MQPGEKESNRGELPYNAIIVTEHYREAPPHVQELCAYCHQPMGAMISIVGVPSLLKDGVPTIPTRRMVCNETCALDWLHSFEPKPLPEKKKPANSLALPASAQEMGWIYAYSEVDGYPLNHPLRSGKWLVFLNETNIDRYWQRIRDAVITGKMGNSAKVSTGGSAKARNGRHVICVYTYDCEDKDDAMRIRQKLRECGILRPIRYKRNLDTGLLRYGSDYTPIYEA